MPQIHVLRVTTPDDMEEPEILVRDAVQHYLYEADLWRSVEIVNMSVDPVPYFREEI